jgi:hypothetical protein
VRWRRSFLHFGTLGLALGMAPLCAKAEPDCGAETAMLQGLSSGVRIDIGATHTLIAGSAIEVSWQSKAPAPLKTPLFIVLAVPGEVRFEAQPLPTKPKSASDETSLDPQPSELPGFIALTPDAKGPLGLAFGAGKSRALIPLHQPGSKLAGSFAIRIYDAGEKAIEAGVVATTSCGERIVSTPLSRTVTMVPGQPEIVVQDPFDIETPTRVMVSNSRRYRANIFDDRYRIYDSETGAKLVDRAGHDPNFSPTSRFVVANTGAKGSGEYEVIDLVSGNPIATPSGSYIGWAHSDSFLIIGSGSWGALSVRPTLISRAIEPKTPATEGETDGPGEPPDDGLGLQHPGSCHACASWSDDNLMLDLDNGILALPARLHRSHVRGGPVQYAVRLAGARPDPIQPNL